MSILRTADEAPMMPWEPASAATGRPLAGTTGNDRPACAHEGSAERGFRNAHLASMPLDGTLHDRKAQPVTHLPAGGRIELHKRLEHPAALRFRNTGPVILHSQLVPAIAYGKHNVDSTRGVPTCVVQEV